MKMRPQSSLRRVLDDLGATLLEVVCGDAVAVDEIGGVAIHDPVDEPVLPRRALVLGVGTVTAGGGRPAHGPRQARGGRPRAALTGPAVGRGHRRRGCRCSD